MDDNLRLLAEKLGVSTRFTDAGLVRKDYEVSEDIIRRIASALGYNAWTSEDVNKSLAEFERRQWSRTLETIYVVEEGNVEFTAVIPSSRLDAAFDIIAAPENSGPGMFGQLAFRINDTGERYVLNDIELARISVRINTAISFGYYNLTFKIDEDVYYATLAVAPRRCYENAALASGKIWGLNVQLYSLKSEHNWGIGDFTDLSELVKISARSGANIIGLNPLNVLNHTYPEDASPYSSLSRLFMNPMYIDIENVPEFLPSDREENAELIKELRESELIRYTEVYQLKVKLLKEFYKRFKFGKDQNRQTDYQRFCESKGVDLDKMATFQCIYDEKCASGWCGGWRAWEKDFQDFNSEAMQKYIAAHKDTIEFFKFMQFETERQFDQAHQTAVECGMRMGFYRDLPVGVSADSTEVWSNPELFIPGVGAGAPPDAFFPAGQKWCLGTFNPFVLKDKCYQPFIKILRANMRFAGALRIDHVMGLMRLYIIPDEGTAGTYLYFNFRDMLNIVALESHLNQCMIVGESIGNVPDGFIDTLRARNVYSLSVLWAERFDAGWGDFRSPQQYPEYAFTSIGTHDMAPLRMWWFGYDIALMRSLDIIDTDEAQAQAYQKREADRWKLLHVLDINGVWPEDNLRKADYLFGEAYPEGIEEAVHRFGARTVSKVFLAQPEDIFHVEKMQNLPGVDRDKHPNWRRKLPVNLEKFEEDIAFIRNIKAIRRER